MVLYAAVMVCALLAALLVYRYDLYNREPWPALVGAAVAGALAMRAAELLERPVLVRLDGETAAAATAALVEELLRLALVVLIAFVFRRTFDDPMDGLVYGSIVGLGMGVEESFALLGLVQGRSGGLLPAEAVRLMGHLVMGGITGFGVGMLWMRRARWAAWMAGTAVASMALHFSWDLVALGAAGGGGLGRNLTAAAVVVVGMLLYGGLVVVGSSASRSTFAPTSPRTLWGWPFARRGAEADRDRHHRGGEPPPLD